MASILSNNMRGLKAPGKVRKAEVMMVVVLPVICPRRVHRPLESLGAAGDDDGAVVRVPVLLPRLPEQLQDPRVPQQRHRHREPPQRLVPTLVLRDPERRAALGDRRRHCLRRVVAGGGPGEEMAPCCLVLLLHRSESN